MNNKERILESIQYIEQNLKSEIDVFGIAKKSLCSRYHFIRLFQSIIGISPKKYLIQRRLTESIFQLQNSDAKILDIAFEYQFGSHEVYTRSFQKSFGSTPSKIRKGEVVPLQLQTQQITEDYIFQSDKARNQRPELVEFNEKYLVGVSYFKQNLEDLNLSDEWAGFMKSVNLIQNKVDPAYFYQIQYWSDNQNIEGMHFFIGVEVTDIKSIDPQFVIKFIPNGKYLKFIHKGLSRNVGYTYRYIYNQFLPSSNYTLNAPFNFEFYGENYTSPNSEHAESLLYIPVQGSE